MNYKFLTDDDCKYLLQIGNKQSDLKQIDEVAMSRHCHITNKGKVVSKNSAIAVFGRNKFLSVLSRASFHWTSSFNDDVSMDCSDYFKN